METHTSTFCIGFVVLFSFWCSSLSVAFATSGEANALLRWKNSLPKESQSVLSSWTLLPQNKSSSGLCSWRGIISCNAGSAAEMDLSRTGLTGTLDEFPFTSLPKLTHIDFSENQFSGKIPPEIWQLQHLEILHIAWNQFNGSLPSEIGNLKSLTELVLSENNLEGPIPVSLGNLINLTWLSLTYSSFSGFIPPELGNLINLKKLYLNGNSLSGPIPSTVGNLKKLTTFSLFDNKLAGPIPSELGNMASLTNLDLHSNSLTGPIPTSFGNLTNLVELWLYENHLSGPVPKELGNLKSLFDLDLNQNKLFGPIPSELGNLTSLTVLFLSNNYLNGSIPKSIGSLKNLVILFLDENQLSGPIPSSMANLVTLSSLSLASNNLSGANANFTLPKLDRLYLSFCDLNQFPEFIRESNNLKLLDLSSNKIEGPIPKWMWDLGKDTLQYLHLSNNSLTGSLESFSWKNILTIDLQSNMFQGVLPILPNGAVYLSVSKNFLIGEIPSEICNVNALKILDLSHNNFSGKIPRCLSKLVKSLSVLNLPLQGIPSLVTKHT